MTPDTPTPPSTDETAPGEVLDFGCLTGSEATSWLRANPQQALIEPVGRYGYLVTLRDGAETHRTAVALDSGTHVGTCDCRGFQYHEGPCAHLCTVRKAAFIGETDTNGDRVRIRQVDIDADHAPEQRATEGGDIDRAIRDQRREDRL